MVLPVRHRVPQRFCLLLYSASDILYTQLCNLKIIRKKFQCHLHILTVVHMLICVNMMLSDRKCFQIICLFRKSDFSSLIWYIKWFFYSIQLNILLLWSGWSSVSIVKLRMPRNPLKPLAHVVIFTASPRDG